MEKPITIVIDETKESLVKSINESQLHPYVIKKMLEELLMEVNAIVENEKNEYKNSLNNEEQAIE